MQSAAFAPLPYKHIERRADGKEDQGIQVIRFDKPEFEGVAVPSDVKDETRIALDKETESPVLGLQELRSVLASNSLGEKGITATDSNVLITPGSKYGIVLAIKTLVGHGDEVIVTDPGYPLYEFWTQQFGAKIVRLPLDDRFQIAGNTLQRALTSKTKLIVLNSPQRFCGLLLQNSGEIADLLEEHDVWVLSDEIFSGILFDNKKFLSPASQKKLSEKTIVVDSFSKKFGMGRWRIGFAIGPEEIIEKMGLALSYSMSSVSDFIQSSALKMVRDHPGYAAAILEQLTRRRDLLLKGLDKISGLRTVTPDGTFHMVIDVSSFGLSSTEFATGLLEKANVAVNPGVAFGQRGEGYVRISFAAVSEPAIASGVEKLEAFVSSRN